MKKLSQKLSKPTQHDLAVARGVLRYLKGTLHYCVTFKKCDEGESKVQGYCDADWGSSVSDRKSISGYVFQLSPNSGFVSWKSRKQPVVALSSCEAEYIALAGCVQEALYLRKLHSEIYGNKRGEQPAEIGVDNQGTIAIAKNPVRQQRAKHIDVKYHFLRQSVSDRQVDLYYVPSQNNRADVLTKSTSGKRIKKLLY